MFSRSYHRTDVGKRMCENFPPWTKIARDDYSLGYHFMNAVYGMAAERIDVTIDRHRKNKYLESADPLAVSDIYKSLFYYDPEAVLTHRTDVDVYKFYGHEDLYDHERFNRPMTRIKPILGFGQGETRIWPDEIQVRSDDNHVLTSETRVDPVTGSRFLRETVKYADGTLIDRLLREEPNYSSFLKEVRYETTGREVHREESVVGGAIRIWEYAIEEGSTVELSGTVDPEEDGGLTRVPSTMVTDLSEFLSKRNTGFNFNPADNIQISGTIYGLTYDYNTKDIYLLLTNVPAASGVVRLDPDTVATEWTMSDIFGRVWQSFDYTGYDEAITFPDGTDNWSDELEHTPVSGTLDVYDYQNVDGSGNAILVPPGEYALLDRRILFNTYATRPSYAPPSGTYDSYGRLISETLPPNYQPDEGFNSRYFAEYQYDMYSELTGIGSDSEFWYIPSIRSTPVILGIKADFTRPKLDAELANKPYMAGAALSVNPNDVRPGSNVDVNFTYMGVEWFNWASPTATPLVANLGDANLVEIDERNIHIFGSGNIIEYEMTPFSIDVADAAVTVSIPSGTPSYLTDPLDSSIRVRISYSAERDFEDAGTLQAMVTEETGIDSYPSDYDIITHLGSTWHTFKYAVQPNTIIELSGTTSYEKTALNNAEQEQFTVSQKMKYVDMTYDVERDIFWLVEQNSCALVQQNPTTGEAIKYYLFKPNTRYTTSLRHHVAIGGTSYDFITNEIDRVVFDRIYGGLDVTSGVSTLPLVASVSSIGSYASGIVSLVAGVDGAGTSILPLVGGVATSSPPETDESTAMVSEITTRFREIALED